MSDLVITMEDSTPTPPSGTVSIYPKTDGLFYTKSSAGVENPLKGDQGIQGLTGPGVPAGGTTGQRLKKSSNADHDTAWSDAAASEITNTPSGNLAATDVQAALNEIQSDIDTRATASALSTHVADAANPHSVTKSQVGLGSVPNVDTTNPANITEDATHRFATDAEKTLWNAKVDAATLATHTGDTTSPHGIRRYSANVAMDGTQTTKDVDVSASIADARLAIWQLLDLSTNDFERLLVSIRTPSASTVHITSDPPLMSGNYRLIGVQL